MIRGCRISHNAHVSSIATAIDEQSVTLKDISQNVTQTSSVISGINQETGLTDGFVIGMQIAPHDNPHLMLPIPGIEFRVDPFQTAANINKTISGKGEPFL